MKKLIFLLFLMCFGAKGQNLLQETRFSGPRVFLFAEDFYSRVQFKVKNGNYTLSGYAKDKKFTLSFGAEDVHPLYTFRPELTFNQVEYDSITVVSEDTIVLRVEREGKWTQERPYVGKLILRNNLIYIDAIAQTSMEDYLAGVVEAEGGLSNSSEYLKAQTVLAQTWLLTNFKKHIKDGYHVKDDQSSQAFKGVAHGKNAALVKAAVLAINDTIATYKGKPIIGFYHSNSGGQTVLPEEVYSQSLPYCRRVVDPFSLKGSKVDWTQTYSWEQWNAFWVKEGIQWDAKQWSAFFASLPHDRLSQWTLAGKTVKLETIRRAFKWRSAYVSGRVTTQGVVITGRGFGHGVGMAQQGAMYMGATGFTWKEILNFYFRDLVFVPADSIGL